MTHSNPLLNVLQVVPELETGGVEQTTLDVAEAVIAAGGKAYVVSRGGRLAVKLMNMGAQLILMPVHSKNPFEQWQNYFRLKALIRKESIHIVHVRSRAPAFAALGAAKACGVPTVATYAGVYNAKSALKRAYNGIMTKADRIIANSEFTRNHILSTYPRCDATKVIAIPRGINFDQFTPKAVEPARLVALAKAWGLTSDPAQIRFLHAGRLTRWKGQAFLIEVAHGLKQSGFTHFTILMAGDEQGRQDYRYALQSKITEYRLEDQVRLVGHCSDMAAAYSLCDFALAPSLDPEAFGRTAVEPQAMERPVLASDHGATSETIIEGVTGWRVAPGDAEVWVQAMIKAMSLTPETREHMGKAGRKNVASQFSLKTMCAATIGVYAALLSQTAKNRS